jgi:hypothetical protein
LSLGKETWLSWTQSATTCWTLPGSPQAAKVNQVREQYPAELKSSGKRPWCGQMIRVGTQCSKDQPRHGPAVLGSYGLGGYGLGVCPRIHVMEN